MRLTPAALTDNPSITGSSTQKCLAHLWEGPGSVFLVDTRPSCKDADSFHPTAFTPKSQVLTFQQWNGKAGREGPRAQCHCAHILLVRTSHMATANCRDSWEM